ncbi:MAG: phosphatase PAP2 family protein [Clostridium sp.]
MKNFFHKYGHIWILGYGFIYLPWFMHLEKTITHQYHIMHSALDDLIPFNEYFVIPYFLWFVYVAGTIGYFFFANKEDYYRLCIFLFTGMTLSLLICTLFPNGTNFRPIIDPDKNLCSKIVALLYQTDTSTNVFPSIHVYNSIGTHIAIMKSEALRKHKLVRVLSFVLMVSICMATVCLKQHSIIDVVGAVLLCGAIYPLAYATSNQNVGDNQPENAFIR